jgi:hypothetical protein
MSPTNRRARTAGSVVEDTRDGGLYMNDDTLRLRIREKFLTHQLPTQSPAKTWGGRAANNTCAVCDGDIGMNEIEAESADAQTRFYHPHCYHVLCAERASIAVPHATAG